MVTQGIVQEEVGGIVLEGEDIDREGQEGIDWEALEGIDQEDRDMGHLGQGADQEEG
jgi:hypothetical protein